MDESPPDMPDSKQAAKQALKHKRILVCGGRRYGMPKKITETDPQKRKNLMREATSKAEHEKHFLWKVLTELAPVELITGDALGADMLSAEWAKGYGVKYQVFKADWDRWGWAAGPIRNQEMHDETRPDLVVAFPGGKGTASMCSIASKAGTRVIHPVPGPEPIGEGYKVPPATRKLIVDLYAKRGYHCDTALLIFVEGVPRDLQEECEEAHKQAISGQPSAISGAFGAGHDSLPDEPIEDPADKYRELYDRLLEARQEKGGELPEIMEELFHDCLERYWAAMSAEEQRRFRSEHEPVGKSTPRS